MKTLDATRRVEISNNTNTRNVLKLQRIPIEYVTMCVCTHWNDVEEIGKYYSVSENLSKDAKMQKNI